MFKLMWKISIAKATQHAFPNCIFLLLSISCVSFSLLFYLITMASGSMTEALVRTAIFLGVLFIFTIGLLWLSRTKHQFKNTLSGLLASLNVILVICIFPYLIISSVMSEQGNTTVSLLGYGFCSLLLIIAASWLYAIYGFIFKTALDTTYREGLIAVLPLFSTIALCLYIS